MYDYLISSFFSCKKHIKQKYSQIEYAKKLLNEHIDIQYIIKKLIEVEKLKFVLLNEN